MNKVCTTPYDSPKEKIALLTSIFRKRNLTVWHYLTGINMLLVIQSHEQTGYLIMTYYRRIIRQEERSRYGC